MIDSLSCGDEGEEEGSVPAAALGAAVVDVLDMLVGSFWLKVSGVLDDVLDDVLNDDVVLMPGDDVVCVLLVEGVVLLLLVVLRVVVLLWVVLLLVLVVKRRSVAGHANRVSCSRPHKYPYQTPVVDRSL